MPKRSSTKERKQSGSLRREKARLAFDRVVEDIHEDNRMLQGEELYLAVLEVFFDMENPFPGEPEK